MKGTNEFLEIKTIVLYLFSSYFEEYIAQSIEYNLPIQNIFSNGQVVLALSNVGIVSDKTFKALPSFNFPNPNWDGTADDSYHDVHQSHEGSKEVIIQMSHSRPLHNVQALE